MPKKTKSGSKKNKNKKILESDDEEVLVNSEDEYSSQSGGQATEPNPETSLDDDSENLDIDPDDEKDIAGDGIYNPVEGNEELEDADEETENEEEGPVEEEEAIEEEVGEEEVGEEGEETTAGETKICHMKNLNKDFLVLDEDDSNMYGKMEYKKISKGDRQTDPIMTYYEMVRIIGTRAQQFNYGAEPLVNGLEGMHPAKMAYIELIAKMTPYIIRRHLPGKLYEDWFLDELEIIHTISDDFFVPGNFDWETLMKYANKLNEMETSVSKTKSKNKKL